MKRLVVCSRPQPDGLPEVYVQTVKADTPYEAVELFDATQAVVGRDTGHFGRKTLEDIMPIHNPSGLRDVKQVAAMAEALPHGHIFHNNGLPNVKIVVTPSGELLLFDGHHTMLSYLQCGARFLEELPYMVVSDPQYGPVTAEEMSAFFPKAHQDLVAKQWDAYVVNWNATPTGTIEPRTVSTMRDLARFFSERHKGSSQ